MVASSTSSSFTTRRVNKTTFVIREDDAYAEHPLIYVKVHPKAPVIVVCDTGCDEPDERHKNGRWCWVSARSHPIPTSLTVMLSSRWFFRPDSEPWLF